LIIWTATGQFSSWLGVLVGAALQLWTVPIICRWSALISVGKAWKGSWSLATVSDKGIA
jgi:hypothetical protein